MDTSTLSRQDTEDYLLTVSKLEASVYMQEKFVDDLNQRNAKLKKEYQEEENAELPVAKLPEKESFWANFFGKIFVRFTYDYWFCRSILTDSDISIFFRIVSVLFFNVAVRFLVTEITLSLLHHLIPSIRPFVRPAIENIDTSFTSLEFWIPIIVFWIVIRLVVGLVGGIISGIKGLMHNSDEQLYYRAALIKEQEAKRTHVENMQRLSTKVANMNAWVSAARDSLQKSKGALAKAYSYDIIHPKYRNLVAVYTMYEYFQAGRCSVLTGHEGAYNLYENESRQNHIISMLGQINERLDGMEKNQYYLWSAIKDTQSSLSSLSYRVNRSMNTLSAKVESAKYSAELAEQNTRTMLYLDTFRSK
ncbi:MAG: hypothetical protein IKM84_08495 [Oscillospiraceae bacterium]|nr:hypothetical protein [Oscillospiraceae bacterium]